MKINLLKLIFLTTFVLTVVLVSFTPDTVTAQAFVPCEGPDCNFCHFVTLANNVITWLIGVLAVVFGAMVFIAGIGLVTSGGNPSKLEEAKKSLTNALIGLIVVLASWLIVDTLLKAMLPNGTTAIGPWNTISCQGGQVVGDPLTAISRPESTGLPSGRGGIVDNPGELTHSSALSQLNPNGFAIVSSGNCSDSSLARCTSLEGVKINTINRLNQLQSAVGIKLTITGGTEYGHAASATSHANGYKIDLRPTDRLNSYIENNFQKVGATTYRDSNGNTYYRHEPDHWDITFTR